MSTELAHQFENTSAGDVGIFGDPVEHSLSPIMQNAAFEIWSNVFKKHGKPEMRYHKFHVPAAQLEAGLDLAKKHQLKGLNITIPHKIKVCPLLDDLDPFAKKVKSVNTILINDGKMVGSNTDGIGFVHAVMHDMGFDPHDKKALLLGAGGTGRVIAMKLQEMGADRIFWWNRSPNKVTELIREGGENLQKAVPVNSERQLKDSVREANIIINSTSVGLNPEDGLPAPHLKFNLGQFAFDVIYHRKTRFLQEAQAAGSKTLDGLSMLIHQGAQSFQIWTGAPAPIEVMKEALIQNTKKV